MQSNRKLYQQLYGDFSKLFYSYIVVGDMTEAVQIYVDTHDIAKVADYQNSILNQYRMDIAQYARDHEKIKIQTIFDSIPAQLNKKKQAFLYKFTE